MKIVCWFLVSWIWFGFFGCAGKSENNDSDAGCQAGNFYTPPLGEEDLSFHVGPYLGHTTQTTVAVGWETIESGDTRLEYGPDSNYGQTIQGETGTMHQVVVKDLVSGTSYHYKACSGDVCTHDLTFATEPGSNRPIRFVVYGDCQDGPEAHRQMIEQILLDQPALAIVVGDTVSDGQYREQFKERYFDPARPLTHFVHRYAAIGNHDRKDVEAVHFIDYAMHPEDPDVPQAETSYSFVYGDAFFLVFDNTLDHYDFFFPLGGVDQPLWRWIQDQVASEAAQNARWRFAFAHYPADTNCHADDDIYTMPESAVREYILPLLWEHGFQGYFAGHVHCYERFDFDGHLVITT
ncbi:MAG: metallophosphoesterase, partial [Deltaproteobacteria bacterium]|nr:metallophosphoesterase [Deltaproteobacteria bacterium]